MSAISLKGAVKERFSIALQYLCPVHDFAAVNARMQPLPFRSVLLALCAATIAVVESGVRYFMKIIHNDEFEEKLSGSF